MKPEDLEKFFNHSQKVNLSDERRESIKKEVILFMKKSPMPAVSQKNVFFGFFSMDNFLRLKTPNVVLAGFVVVVLLGGFTSVKAYGSLPGDLLYSVKGFNEKIQQALAISPQAKVHVNIKLANERLKEAERLMAKGKLSKDKEEQLSKNFNLHTQITSENVGVLEKSKKHNTSKATADFEASLLTHKANIIKLQQRVEIKKEQQAKQEEQKVKQEEQQVEQETQEVKQEEQQEKQVKEEKWQPSEVLIGHIEKAADDIKKWKIDTEVNVELDKGSIMKIK